MKKFFTHADSVLPVHHPRVLVQTAMAQGADRDALLANADVSAETLDNPDARISYVQFAMLTHNALALTGNPALGLDFGRNIHLAHMGVLGLALMSSANLGEALRVGIRYYRTLAPAWDIDVRVEGRHALITAREAIPLSPFRVFATEALVSAINSQGLHLLGRQVPAVEVRVHYPEPAHSARYRELYDGPLRFDQDVTQIVLDAQLLHEPLAGADPATARLAEQFCANQLSTIGPLDGLVARVRGALSAARGPHPDMDELARSLQTSARSLRRSLQRMGTSYQELLDQTRRVRAEEWIRSTRMTVEEMAAQLGFSDVRSFRRAFKRWTGSTPNALRTSGSTAKAV